MKRKAVLVIAVIVAIAIYERRSCPIEQGWMGPVPHYDYLRNITFEKRPVNDYPEPAERRFGCRITFDRDPFPGGCGEGRVFYACPLD